MAKHDFRSHWWFELIRRGESAIAWSRRASSAFVRPAVLIAVFLVLMPVCILLIRPAVHASGTTWYVSTTGDNGNDCLSAGTACLTIGGAISKASAGDTIDVAAGTYNEQVVVNSSLTLNGAQQGVDARTRSGLESIVTNTCGPFQIEADNVTLNGFTIEGAASTCGAGLNVGVWTNPGFSGTHGGTQILNNIIQDNISGIELDNDGTYQTKVQYNLILNNNNSGPGPGNGIETNFGLANALIDNNEFVGQTNESVVVEAVSSNFTISNNVLDAGIALIDSSTISISGNMSFGDTAEDATIDLAGGDSGVSVTGNALLNGWEAIVVEDPYSVGANSSITVNSNCISNNAVAGLAVASGSYSGGTGSLDATNNWWGATSGPKYNSGGLE